MLDAAALDDRLAVRLAALAAGPVEAHVRRPQAGVPGECGLRQRAPGQETGAIFLARAPEPAAGSIVTVTREGGRPLLIELQALVDRMRFGAPRRVAQGLDANRLAMLLAAANRHAGVSLQEHDVFVNVVGGIEISETAWDVPVLIALASSLADRVVPASGGARPGPQAPLEADFWAKA